MKKVKPISRDRKGNLIFHLAADEANADWLHSLRLMKAGKTKELNKLFNSPMFTERREKSHGKKDSKKDSKKGK